MKLELADRKHATKKGLKELQNLVSSFDFADDIQSVTSFEFYVEADIGGQNEYIWTTEGYWHIDGMIELRVGIPGETHFYKQNLEYVKKIDFKDALKALEDVIDKYNARVSKKEAQIEEFLSFCVAYNSIEQEA